MVVGAVVTTVIQSSSATTVMVIGFVNAGLMNLQQAIGVIMGANIGTTVTAQLIAFKLGDYAYLLAGLGFAFYFFGKRKYAKHLGQVFFGFGLLFIGINIMSDVLEPLAGNERSLHLITQMSSHPGVCRLGSNDMVQQWRGDWGAQSFSQPVVKGIGSCFNPWRGVPILLEVIRDDDHGSFGQHRRE